MTGSIEISFPEDQQEGTEATVTRWLVAEGDMVALHTHQVWPGDEEYVTMDIFRFDENGKMVEHWDSMQQIPEVSANGNTMY